MPASGQHALVTGATGFTGQHLCRRLLAEGCTVRALCRDRRPPQELLDKGVEVVPGDVRAPESLAPALDGIDIVYHLAAAFRAGRLSRDELFETNVQGTRNTIAAAARAGVGRFVHCSTVGVHGEVLNPPASEQAPFRPGDAYQSSKMEGELVARQFALLHDLPLVVIRPAGIYGPGDLRFLKLVKAVQKPVLPIIGNGDVLYQMVFIDDLIDGVLEAGTSDVSAGKVYILTGRAPVTFNDLVATVGAALGRKPRTIHVPFAPIYLLSIMVEYACAPFGIEPPLFRRRLDIFRKDRSFDISRAREDLGYEPKVGLLEGFARTIEWYRENGLLR